MIIIVEVVPYVNVNVTAYISREKRNLLLQELREELWMTSAWNSEGLLIQSPTTSFSPNWRDGDLTGGLFGG